ncbi:MAG: hypothetical protein KatS3mg010_1809 [Acidimicrobiia bacterium]|nr:MAG: hypothetical protein KatS3mg010_1809 [Acidimicrobiia bacterium]
MTTHPTTAIATERAPRYQPNQRSEWLQCQSLIARRSSAVIGSPAARTRSSERGCGRTNHAQAATATMAMPAPSAALRLRVIRVTTARPPCDSHHASGTETSSVPPMAICSGRYSSPSAFTYPPLRCRLTSSAIANVTPSAIVKAADVRCRSGLPESSAQTTAAASGSANIAASASTRARAAQPTAAPAMAPVAGRASSRPASHAHNPPTSRIWTGSSE